MLRCSDEGCCPHSAAVLAIVWNPHAARADTTLCLSGTMPTPAHHATAAAPCTQHPTSRLHPPSLLQLPVRGYCFTLKLGNLQASPVHPSDHMHSKWDIPWLHSRCSNRSGTTRYQGTAVSTPALAVVKPFSCSWSVSGAGQQVCHSVAGHCAEWMTVVHS